MGRAVASPESRLARVKAHQDLSQDIDDSDAHDHDKGNDAAKKAAKRAATAHFNRPSEAEERARQIRSSLRRPSQAARFGPSPRGGSPCQARL
eukprot:1257922-Pyramimonas_sp.AAC.1